MKLSSAHKAQLLKVTRVATAGAMVVSSLSAGLVAPAQASQLSGNSTLISDSRLQSGGGTGVTYVISFTPPTTSTTEIEWVDVQFCAEAGSWSDTCTAPTNFDLNVTLNASVNNFGVTGGPNTLNAAARSAANAFNVDLTGAGTAETSVAHTITLTGSVTNPSVAGTYYTRVRTYAADSSTTPIDEGESAFAVLSKTTVSGRVLESMTFAVNAITSGNACGTYENATVTSTASTVPFGNFNTGTPRVGCQRISTATNADGGYATTIKEVLGGTAPQGGMCRQTALNCTAEGGSSGVSAADVIGDTGINGTPSLFDAGADYGLGFGVSGAHKDSNFTAINTYRSMFGASPIAVSSFGDPTDATTSQVYVVFKADVSPVQTAGTYQNAIEYITTPTF